MDLNNGFAKMIESPESFELNDLVINKEASFFVRVKGESHSGFKIHDRDLLIVDRCMEKNEGDLILCAIDGEFCIRKIKNLNPIVLCDHNNKLTHLNEYTNIEYEGCISGSFSFHKKII